MILFRIEETARKYRMFPEGGAVVCAVSGGADSMAMLCALIELRERLKLGEILCAHLNHCLRGEESDRDESFVRGFCAQQGIRFFSARADVAAEARKRRKGIEETARLIRYGFLKETADAAGAPRICTAHTADDNAETVLLNLSRGAGISGLSGIPPVRGRIVRPLIGVSRAEVLSYLDSRSVGHVEDSTNADTAYFRNRIRREVIPALKSRNPSFLRSVSSTAEILRRDAEFLGLSAEEAYARTASEGAGRVSLELGALSDLPPALFPRVCRLAFGAAGGNPGGLTFSHTEKLLALVRSDKPSSRLSLPGNIRARREYGALVFENKAPSGVSFEPFLLKDGLNRAVGTAGFQIFAQKAEKNESIYNSLNTFYLNYDIMNNDIFVRPRREGDRFRLPGRNVSKSLKKLFIEAKVPAHLRACVPVLALGSDIVAVAGFGMDGRYGARTPEGALRVEFKRFPAPDA